MAQSSLAGRYEAAARRLAAEDQLLRSLQRAGDAADHGLGSDASADLRPPAPPGSLGPIEPLRDNTLQTRAGVGEHPGAGDSGIGGGRGEDRAVGQAAAEELSSFRRRSQPRA